MAEQQLQEWVNKIDIGNDKKTDRDFVDVKSQLVKDMEKLWELKLRGKITQEEYSRYGIKFKEILEKNFSSTNEVKKRYEETRKPIREEATFKTKNEKNGTSEKKDDKNEISENMIFNGDFEANINNLLYPNGGKLDNINYNKLDKLLEKSFLSNDRSFYKKFIKKIPTLKTCSLASLKLTEKYKKLSIEVEKKDAKLEKVVYKIFGKENGKELLEKIDSSDSCSFNLIKIINDFAKLKGLKVSFNENKNISQLGLEIKIATEKSKQNYIAQKVGISEKELIKARNNGNFGKITENIPAEYKEALKGTLEKKKKTEDAIKRLQVITEDDFGIITNPENKNKSPQELMEILEKQNKELAKINEQIRKEEEISLSQKKPKTTETEDTITQNKENKKINPELAKKFSMSSSVEIPGNIKNMSSNEKGVYFNTLFNGEKIGGGKTIVTPSGAKFDFIKRAENNFDINYGGIEHKGLNLKEIRNSVSFANFTADLGLNFLIPYAGKILRKINEKETLIEDRDGLNDKEKSIIISKLGKAIIPGFKENNTNIEKNISQFTRIKSNPIKYNNSSFSNIELLTKTKFGYAGGTELNIDKLLADIS
ncbi:MAG: hypothetical protein PHZ26_05655 [Candidatus Gracilibacteria bacterium]|nr:hypothetical protein [Candidatus Gracilibacteria bacterium]